MSWTAIAEMLGCMEVPPNTMGTKDLTVLERQQARLKWQQQQSTITTSIHPQDHIFTARTPFETINGLCRKEDRQGPFFGVESDGNGWPDLMQLSMVGDESLDGHCPGFSRTLSCPPRVRAIEKEKVEMIMPSSLVENGQGLSPAMAKEGGSTVTTNTNGSEYKKRKVANAEEEEEAPAESNANKKIKEETTPNITAATTKDNSSSIDAKTGENSSDSSKEASKVSEVVQKPDYIHVRARRGQATDSHSLAERVRREKISERMKYLQDLVPGCNRITGKAGMLDEIINYVQSLQKQVEFLSMKLAAVSPTSDFNVDGFLTGKENVSTWGTGASSAELIIPSYLSNLNQMQHSSYINCGPDMPMDSPQQALRRTISAPLPVPDTFLNPCFDIHAWDAAADLQILPNVQLHHRKVPLQGILGAYSRKTEM